MRHACVALLTALVATSGAWARPASPPARARPARAPVVRTPRPLADKTRGPGSVEFVTKLEAKDSGDTGQDKAAGGSTVRAFLNRGTEDGIKVGDSIAVQRGPRKLQPCVVQTVSEHSSTCSGIGLKAGDMISVVRKPDADQKFGELTVPGWDELSEQRTHVDAQAFVLFDAQGTGSESNTRRFHLAASHTTFASLVAPNGPFQWQNVRAGINGFEPVNGLSIWLDASVSNWSRRPPLFRSLLTGTPQLFVRELSVLWRPASLPLVAGLGRLVPRHTPGLVALDGAQVGVRLADDAVEVGAFGGLIPNALSLVPSTSWTAGAYGAFRIQKGRGATGAVLDLDARAGWAMRPALSSRFEAGVGAHAFLGRELRGSLQAIFGSGPLAGPGLLDAATFDLGWNPTETLTLTIDGRYRGLKADEVPAVGVATLGTRSVHAFGHARYEISSEWFVTVSGGAAIDLSEPGRQGWVGPELTWIPMTGGRLEFNTGYLEEFGYFPGRSAWLGTRVSPISRLRLAARATWFQQSNLELREHDVGLGLNATWRIMPWLWTALNFQGRLAVAGGPTSANDNAATKSPARAGGVGMISLGADL